MDNEWVDPVKTERALCLKLNEHDAHRPRGAGVKQADIDAWAAERAVIIHAIDLNARRVRAYPSPLDRLRAGINANNIHTTNLGGRFR